MASRGKSRWFNVVVGFGLAIVLLWFFFRGVSWSEVGRAIENADIRLLVVAFCLNVASIVLRCWRWQVLLRPLKSDVPYRPVWKYFNVGFAVSSLLPGRLGELLRPYLLARDQKIKFASSLATVVVERVIELAIVLSFLGTAFLFPAVLGSRTEEPGVAEIIDVIEGVAFLALVAVAGATVFLLLVKLKTSWALAIVGWFSRPLPRRLASKLSDLVQAFADGVAGLRGARQHSELALSTVLSWVVLLVGYWLQLRAFDIHVPFYFIFFMTSMVALGVVVPTPGGSGTFHAALIVVVGELWGFSETHGGAVAACAIVSHLLGLLPVVTIGVYYLFRDGIDIFAVAEEASERGKEEVPEEPSSE